VDDASLVAAVRQGDVSAYGALYAAHVGAVRTTVRAQMSDREAAEDVVQDVFVRALESLPKLDDAARFRPWLLSIARHTAIDARRAVRVTEEVVDREGGVEPDRLAELGEMASLVWGTVAGLSARDGTAMAMVSLGFGIADVAVALGVSHGAAKVAVHRARERARTALLLEVLVRRHGPVCPGASGDVVSVARHVRSCGDCARLVRQSL
jgi:RNA polymerase sigma factor (sigma-70 family)